MASFMDAAQELATILTLFQEGVYRGVIRPMDGEQHRGKYGRTVILGLEVDSDWYVSLTQSADSGFLWVTLHDSTGESVDEWSEHEIGSDLVRQVWHTCRNQLYSNDVERGVTGVTKWLRRQM